MKIESIILRNWIEEDLDVYYNWFKDDYKWMKYNGPYYPTKSLQDVRVEIEQFRRDIKNSTFPLIAERFVIADKKTNQLIGTVGRYWQSKETNWLSIGITIYDNKYWSKGIGYEALSLWIDYLFNEMDQLVRLDLRTWSGNTGMMKLASKLGFKLEARFRKARIVNGEYYDSLGYGILREEWFDLRNI